MTSPLHPLSNMVLMKPVDLPEKIGRIYVPEQAKKPVQEGIVVAVGPGSRDKTGRLIPCEVRVGDRVRLRHTFDTQIQIRGEKFIMAPEDEIMGIIEG